MNGNGIDSLISKCPKCGAPTSTKRGVVTELLKTFLIYECTKCPYKWIEPMEQDFDVREIG